ncbi:MAG: hypothetical protein KDJ37_03655 [Hyphomicrobiaceae bacterium]|nr:hypothetical protein [Hyphomicrobiaceae bacterium]
MTSKTMIFGALAAGLAIVATTGSAEAGRRHFGGGFHKHHHHHHFFRPRHYVYIGPSCGYYYKKWKYTGSSYWKYKYYDCVS